MSDSMNNDSLVSVIVPMYNCQHTVLRCVDSILKQTYVNIEIILVDDGSTDNTYDICRDAFIDNNRISMIQVQQNLGVSHARNVGMLKAKGEYISFCDADDIMMPAMIERLIKYQKELDVDIVCCNYVGSKQWVTHNEPSIMSNKREQVLSLEKYGGYVWNKIFSRKLVDDISFDEDLNLCEDMLFLVKCISKGCKLAYVSDRLYSYEVGGVTTGASDNHFINGEFGYQVALKRAAGILGNEWKEYFTHRIFVLAVIENDFHKKRKCLAKENELVLKRTLKETKGNFLKDRDFSLRKRLLFYLRYLLPYSKYIKP